MNAGLARFGADRPFPCARIPRISFSIRSHKVMSGSFPVNIGVGKSIDTFFSISSFDFAVVGWVVDMVCSAGLIIVGEYNTDRHCINPTPQAVDSEFLRSFYSVTNSLKFRLAHPMYIR